MSPNRRKSQNRISAGNSDVVRVWICALLGALFLSVTYHWGRQLDAQGNVNFTALSTWLWILGTATPITPALAWLFGRLPEMIENKREKRRELSRNGAKERKQESAGQDNAGRDDTRQDNAGQDDTRQENVRQDSTPGGLFARLAGLSLRGQRLLTALCLFLAWLPVFAAVYPGFFAYDATDELQEVLTGQYVTRHPLVHVLLLGKIVTGVEQMSGSYNIGIAVYVLLQMAGMALLLAWMLQSLRRLGAGKGLYAAGFLFLAFFPVIPMYVMCTSKDILYTAGMLAAVTLLCLMRRDPEGFGSSIKNWLGLGIALLVMAMLRNNGFYVFLVMIPALCALVQKKYRKRMLAVIVMVLTVRAGVNGALDAALKPVNTDVQETLTVPIQQLARTWNYSPEVFEEAEREALFEILPQEVLERYNPKLSDLVKIDFGTEYYEKNPRRYQSLWLRIGAKAPLTYVNAWLMTSYGFWYPFTVIDVYNGSRYYTESSYFSCETEAPGWRHSFFPQLEKVYQEISWGAGIHRIPVLSWLFSPGFLCWVYVLAGLFLLSQKRWDMLGILIPVYGNWLTVLLGPTYLVRYVLIFWFALPLLLTVCLSGYCHSNTNVLYFKR